MGSALEEQFAEFVWRMEWLQEAEQKLALTRANRLYLEGLRPPENYHVTYHRDQAEANAAQAAQQGAPAEPDSSVGWMTRNLWGCSWYATAMMIDDTLDVGHNWRKTSGRRCQMICTAGTYAAVTGEPSQQQQQQQHGPAVVDPDLLRVMYCYHRAAFLLDSMVTVYSIVPDGDAVVALHTIEHVRQRAFARLGR